MPFFVQVLPLVYPVFKRIEHRYQCHKRYHFFTPKTILNVNKIKLYDPIPTFCSSLSNIAALLTTAA